MIGDMRRALYRYEFNSNGRNRYGETEADVIELDEGDYSVSDAEQPLLMKGEV